MGPISPVLVKLKAGFKTIAKLGLYFSVYFTVTNEVGDWYLIGDHSMEPALSDGDIVIVQPVGHRGFFTGNPRVCQSFQLNVLFQIV